MQASTLPTIPSAALPGAPAAATPVPEHLSPHDIVTYFRCPHEMELHRAQHLSWRTGQPVLARTPLGTPPSPHSPLGPPPGESSQAMQGRLIVGIHDQLVYEDPDETGIPALFPSEQNHAKAFLRDHGATLTDHAWGLSGRPDLVVRRGDGSYYPVEFKETHLWEGYHEAHGRFFDVLQVIAECRLVEATWGAAPRAGVVYYGDTEGSGERQGTVEVPYGEPQREWLQHAMALIRADRIRAPVPAERNCNHCEPNRDGLCKYAQAGFSTSHRNEPEEPGHRRRFY